jgi:hypothetical protein
MIVRIGLDEKTINKYACHAVCAREALLTVLSYGVENENML